MGPTTNRVPAVMAWSSGKDSALALQKAHFEGAFDVQCLMTTVAEGLGRVSVHGVRLELLEAQAKSIGLPLVQIPIPVPCPNSVSEQRWRQALEPWKARAIRKVLFADVFIEDIRRFREQMLASMGMQAEFPLWGQKTPQLSKEILEHGMQSLVVCVDTKKLPAEAAGTPYDAAFVQKLPANVDPCGENGEFHTFVVQAPFFKTPIDVEVGEGVTERAFRFADLKLAGLSG